MFIMMHFHLYVVSGRCSNKEPAINIWRLDSLIEARDLIYKMVASSSSTFLIEAVKWPI